MATQFINAVRLARDPARLQQAPAEALVTAAAVLSKSLVSVIDGAGLQEQRASALDMIDSAGRAIGAEIRRRQ